MHLTAEQAKLVEDNKYLVNYCVNRYIKPKQADYEDCLAEGMLGLCCSAVNFDATKGFQFSTYAVSYITGVVKRFVRERNRLLKIPRDILDLNYQIIQLRLSSGYEISDEEIMKQLNITPCQFLEATRFDELSDMERIVSSECSGNPLKLKDCIPDSKFQSALEDSLEECCLISIKDEVLVDMIPKHKDIYNDYFYSRLAGDGMSQQELSKKHQVSQPQIHRIITKINKAILNNYKQTLCS